MLAPGQSKTVTIVADSRLLASFDASAQRWIVPAGDVSVEIARSATDPVLSGTARLARSEIKP